MRRALNRLRIAAVERSLDRPQYAGAARHEAAHELAVESRIALGKDLESRQIHGGTDVLPRDTRVCAALIPGLLILHPPLQDGIRHIALDRFDKTVIPAVATGGEFRMAQARKAIPRAHDRSSRTRRMGLISHPWRMPAADGYVTAAMLAGRLSVDRK